MERISKLPLRKGFVDVISTLANLSKSETQLDRRQLITEACRNWDVEKASIWTGFPDVYDDLNQIFPFGRVYRIQSDRVSDNDVDFDTRVKINVDEYSLDFINHFQQEWSDLRNHLTTDDISEEGIIDSLCLGLILTYLIALEDDSGKPSFKRKTYHAIRRKEKGSNFIIDLVFLSTNDLCMGFAFNDFFDGDERFDENYPKYRYFRISIGDDGIEIYGGSQSRGIPFRMEAKDRGKYLDIDDIEI